MKNLNKTAAMATMALTAAMATAQIGVTVDGNPVQFSGGAAPRYIDGRVLVPLRGVFEEMGANVDWDRMSRTITASANGRDIKLKVGSHTGWVDGQRVQLDVPAQIIGGNTMVPIRFLSESLGADVRWDERDRLVLIDTGMGSARTNNQTRPLRVGRFRTYTIPTNTVIPFTLNTELSSEDARKGDQFSATIQTDNGDTYQNLPNGTMIEGHVIAAKRQRGDKPGLLEVGFDRLKMPDGRTVNVDGSLISLDEKNIARTENGRIVAKGGGSKDNRTVWAGYGAGAGLIVGILGKRPLENAAIGGILGYLAGTLQQSQNKPKNVNLAPGTEFGVRLNEDLAIRVPRDNNGGK